MQELADTIATALFQVGAALLIARLLYSFSRDRSLGLLKWVGLRSTTLKSLVAASVLLIAGINIVFVGPLVIPDMHNFLSENSAHLLATRIDSTALLLSIFAIESLLLTSLSEEIFFRGLLGKRLISRLGFGVGNSIQASLFGAIHVSSPFQKLEDPSFQLIAFSFLWPTSFSWLVGWINERLGNGSILPGWLAHSAGNLWTTIYLAFFWP